MKTPAVIALVIADNIRSRRTQAGLRVVDLATRTGISKSHISRFESGTRIPSVVSLCRIAAGLSVGPAALLKGVV
jgi:transcriptional regulator with XRE-family HTH domain